MNSFMTLKISIFILLCSIFAQAETIFDREYLSESGQKVAILNPGNAHATDLLEGDLLWILPKDTIRIGGAPKGVVVLTSGALVVYVKTNQMLSINYWDLNSKKLTTCKNDLSIKKISRGLIKIEYKKNSIRVEENGQYQDYFANCSISQNKTQFLDLTPSDRKILEKYGSSAANDSSRATSELTNPKTLEVRAEIVGREDLLNELIVNLRTLAKRSTLLWGPPGVLPEAVVYQLARKILKKEVPEELDGWSIYEISPSKLSSDGYEGRAQQKMSELLSAASGKKVILFFEDFQQLLGMGTTSDSHPDVTVAIKSVLSSGQISIIGTAPENASGMSLLRANEALLSNFSKIYIPEPDDKILLSIYQNQVVKMRLKSQVAFSPMVLTQLIQLLHRYVYDEKQPQVGLSLIEKMSLKLGKKNEDDDFYNILPEDIKNEISSYAQMPALKSKKDSKNSEEKSFKEKVKEFPTAIRENFVGQPEAVKTVYNSLLRVAAGLNDEKRPAGVFLFLGPSGVGKTYLADVFSEYFGLPSTTYAMNQFTHEGSETVFLGAQPSYVGFTPSGGGLTQWIRNNPTSSLVFDEIDKAYPRILDVLLRLMDEGVIKDNANIEANFRNGFIFMTSNYGTDLIDAYDKEILGLTDPAQGHYSKTYTGYIPKNEEELKKELLNKLTGAGYFGEHFAGRIGIKQIVVFHHFTMKEIETITEQLIRKFQKKFFNKNNLNIEIDPSLKKLIADNQYTFQFGAREAKDLIETWIATPIAEKLLEVDATQILGFKLSVAVLSGQSEPKIEVTIILKK